MRIARPAVIVGIALGCIGAACCVYAQTAAITPGGVLADDFGTKLGTFEVHPFPNGRTAGFSYSIEVHRIDGRRWLLAPIGIDRPTDRAGEGPLVWSVREYTALRLDREGQMFSNP